MSTPPRVTAEQAELAAARIARRHGGHAGDDPREILAYLRKRGIHGLREDEESHDIEDGLILRLFLWWEGESAELRLLEAAEKLGFPRRRTRRVLGIATNQGIADRLDRKRGLLGDLGVPSEKLVRVERAREGEAAARRRDRAATLAAFICLLRSHRDELPPDAADWMDDLEASIDPRRPAAPPSATTEACLRLIARALRGQPGPLRDAAAYIATL